MSKLTSGSAVARFKALGMSVDIDQTLELDQTRRKLIEAQAALTRIGREVSEALYNEGRNT